MNPVAKAFAGAIARWLMVLAGAHGVDVASEDVNALVNAVLIIVPIIWSIIQKANATPAS